MVAVGRGVTKAHTIMKSKNEERFQLHAFVEPTWGIWKDERRNPWTVSVTRARSDEVRLVSTQEESIRLILRPRQLIVLS